MMVIRHGIYETSKKVDYSINLHVRTSIVYMDI